MPGWGRRAAEDALAETGTTPSERAAVPWLGAAVLNRGGHPPLPGLGRRPGRAAVRVTAILSVLPAY